MKNYIRILFGIMWSWLLLSCNSSPKLNYEYKSLDSSDELLIRFLEAPEPTSGLKPAVILLSGGGWENFSWTQHDDIGHLMHDLGLVPMVIQYRALEEFEDSTPMEALEDVQDAIAYIRANHKEFGVDPEKIITLGSSVGGQMGFSSYLSNPRGLEDFDQYQPNLIIAFSPVLRNDSSGYGYDRIGDDFSWFSPYNVYKDSGKRIPPSLIISGDKDPLIPMKQLVEFKQMADEKGDRVTLYSVEDAKHSLRSTHYGIFTKSVPLILEFFAENNIATSPVLIEVDKETPEQGDTDPESAN